MLGKPDLPTVWPMVLVLFPNQKEYGPHSLPQPFVPGGSSDLSAWTADTPQPLDWRREIVRRLIADNAGLLSGVTVTALEDLFSTIEVNATRVRLGAPLPAGALPPDRLRAWAKIQLLATTPEYAGRFRVYLSNLQQGNEESVAARNGFGLTLAELNRRAKRVLPCRGFRSISGFRGSLKSESRFYRKAPSAIGRRGLVRRAESCREDFPPGSPRGLFAEGTAAFSRSSRQGQPALG